MLLVIGGGIAGVTAALEASEAGQEVVLVEKEPFLGGRAVRSYRYFPKHCPPTCGMEINFRRLERNPRVRVIAGARVVEAARSDGRWAVTVVRAPRYVDERCTLCGLCTEACPARVADPFNLGMNEVPAVRRAFGDSWPRRFVLDRHACPEGCAACAEVCPCQAIHLDATEISETLDVGAVVIATGWKPYPLERLPELGGGRLRDVIANVNLERLASPTGPTGGKILRPSDGEPPQKVAFVQCAGSRDRNHLPYCSAVCCLASFKQAVYVKDQLPAAEVTIYYIDRRAPGRNEDVLVEAAATEGVRLVKGKVGSVERRPDGRLALKVEDVAAERLVEESADLVVLATGMVPNVADDPPLRQLLRDEDGFGRDDPDRGVFVAGATRRPEDVAACVRDATGAAGRGMAVALRNAPCVGLPAGQGGAR